MYGNYIIDSFMRRPEQPTSRTIRYYLSTRTQKVPTRTHKFPTRTQKVPTRTHKFPTRTQKVPTKTRNISRRIQPTRTPSV